MPFLVPVLELAEILEKIMLSSEGPRPTPPDLVRLRMKENNYRWGSE